MVPALQAKLLRFLEEKTFKRVGGSADIHVDVRVDRRDEPQPRGGGAAGPVPRGPVLPAERAADRAAAAARRAPTTFRCSSPSTSTRFNREFRKRVRGVVGRRRWSGCRRTAGPATSASCATPSSARCCSCEGDDARRRRLPGSAAARPRSPTASSCRPAASISTSSSGRSSCRRSSARGWNQTRAAALLGLNRDQIRYRIEKFKLEKPAAS